MYIPIFYYLFVKCVSSLLLISLHPTALSLFFFHFNVTCVRGELIKKKKKKKSESNAVSFSFFLPFNESFFFPLFYSSNNALNNKETKETNK